MPGLQKHRRVRTAEMGSGGGMTMEGDGKEGKKEGKNF